MEQKSSKEQSNKSFKNVFSAADHPRQNQRRSSMPASSELSSLHRTTSHKNLPHLDVVDRVKSTPFHFSPKCCQPDKHLHSCHSHCTLPHLPGTSRRRASLPPKLTSYLKPVKENRRKSYPIEATEQKERELHRCKALHRTNITFADIASELRNISNEYRQQDVKQVKSVPTVFPITARKDVSCDFIDRQPSKSFHCANSSVLMVHNIDSHSSGYSTSHSDTSHQTRSLARIGEHSVA
ncbi:uncharacterized protein LOC130646466 isoform X2 [Hydractinia symbiolongicarpus]|uniref:uncharacterized protein LOC130646466 isoform X2 n=1 Tax=Hydractinia symbiolongicarpus TaxID=13093 RepID=UPI00254F6E63|nr:uncharacterized protein LOC130646466 isoform X2 [Hydractinia symbiolongicarpus]